VPLQAPVLHGVPCMQHGWPVPPHALQKLSVPTVVQLACDCVH
jgi:hypothetical protein